MGPIEAVKTGFAKYAQFSGRSGRAEFWWFLLFYSGLFYGAGYLGGKLGGQIPYVSAVTLGALVNIMMIIPLLSSQVRRLHDVGRTGWWVGVFYGGAIVIPFLPNKSESVPLLLTMGTFGLVILAVGLFVIFNYMLGTNAKGDQYDIEPPVRDTVFQPTEYVPPQSYVPHYYPAK